MKRLTLVIGLILAAGILFAQEGKPERKQRREVRIEAYKDRLQLTDEQIASLKEVREEIKPKMKALRETGADSRAEMMRAQADLIEQHEAQVAAILSEDQLAELKVIQEERKTERKDRMRKRKKSDEDN